MHFIYSVTFYKSKEEAILFASINSKILLMNDETKLRTFCHFHQKKVKLLTLLTVTEAENPGNSKCTAINRPREYANHYQNKLTMKIMFLLKTYICSSTIIFIWQESRIMSQSIQTQIRPTKLS